MSIQTEIDRIITAVHAAHEKVAEKGGTTAEPYLVANLAEAIESIPEGSDPVLQSKTVSPSTAAQTVKPDTGYDGLSQVTVNAMATATQATPSITVSSAGKITASATQTAGYVSAGTKSATKQLTVQAAKTVTPTTSNQTAVASGRYTTGAITVKGDANLVAGNIKKGKSIFGVAGSYEGSGSSGGMETCTLNVTNNLSYGLEVVYGAYDGTNFNHYAQADVDSGASKTFNNIPMGSIVVIDTRNESPSYSCVGAEYVRRFFDSIYSHILVFQVQASEASITIREGGGDLPEPI